MVALGRLEDAELLATWQVPSDASLDARHQGVAQADVGERAAQHHLVVARRAPKELKSRSAPRRDRGANARQVH